MRKMRAPGVHSFTSLLYILFNPSSPNMRVVQANLVHEFGHVGGTVILAIADGTECRGYPLVGILTNRCLITTGFTFSTLYSLLRSDLPPTHRFLANSRHIC